MSKTKNTWIDKLVMGGIVLTAIALTIYVVSVCIGGGA